MIELWLFNGTKVLYPSPAQQRFDMPTRDVYGRAAGGLVYTFERGDENEK